MTIFKASISLLQQTPRRFPRHSKIGTCLTGKVALIRGALNREKAAIVINAFADDHCEVLRHELGHHIAVYLCGLNGVERFIDPPTKAMREDSRLDEYCLSSRNEALAESFGLYLEGAPMRHINLKPLLRRVCMNNTRAFSILRNYRKALA